ncbi:hypothetical protein ASD78_10125 [Lysobacter sp. Root667]|uniref:RHS repeat domain-containing protein n=1 Tax=Lysobacter sp. Root667 TaxID=1736581 RepID=UPI0006F9C5F9|nr:RHS repeat-associated core domain-containing protein [Lysobacter sp. Root667]KRA74685.1 hypothetical protein ASD78_10125 [Lysobacter sp. Root667]
MFGGSTHYINYGYDAIDNIRSVSHPGVREHSYWYDTNNRLTNVQNSGGASVVGLSYDVQGNLNNKNGQQYGFDYGNRLRWVMGKENYRYDGHGRRSKIQKDNGLQEWFQYSQAGQYLFSSKLTAGGVQTTQENVYLSGSVIATIDHNWPSNTIIATKYQHTDALGSPVATTDASGALIERTNYEPYGSAINKTVDGIGYTGHVMDGSTGLTYMQQRYYDPTLGRFLGNDSISANSGTGDNFNRYQYANNNPYSYIDPDGRWGCVPSGCEMRATRFGFYTHTPGGIFLARSVGDPLALFTPDNINLLSFEYIDQGRLNEAKISLLAFLTPARYGQALTTEAKTALGGLETRGFRAPPGTRQIPDGVPDHWKIRPSHENNGAWLFDPQNKGNAMRLMPGDPTSPFPNSQNPYVRWQRNGHALDANGNVLPSKKTPDAHIPINDFMFKPQIFHNK